MVTVAETIVTHLLSKTVQPIEEGVFDPNTKFGAGAGGRAGDFQERQYRVACVVDQLEGTRVLRIEGRGSVRLDPSTKTKVNRDLTRLGNDFNSIGNAHNKIAGVLQKHGLEVRTVLNSNLFRGNEGNRLLGVGYDFTYNGGDDSFLPGPELSNSALAFFWFQKDNGRTEVVTYLS